jgi:ribosome biogenesis GTPase / thiamine phosphate phosphatase
VLVHGAAIDTFAAETGRIRPMNSALSDLGLTPFFTQQLTTDEFDRCRIARVTAVQRSEIIVNDGEGEHAVAPGGNWYQRSPEERPTVGDWLLLDIDQDKLVRLLERKSVFKRMAVGTKAELQLIAANIDTLFIVTSCNDEFKESRLERYLALATEAGVDPVVVLTKADLAADPDVFRDRVRTVNRNIPVEIVNTLDGDTLRGVTAWITKGVTVALVGSSGVGKSTLLNTLSGRELMATGEIREQDAKGRHTTSFRSLHLLPGGGLLLDVPGMRELKVAQLDKALDSVFDDIASLARQCRFGDCDHNAEPGCAVRAALDAGQLDERRLNNYRKLVREEQRNSSTLAEKRQYERQFSRHVKEAIDHKRRRDDD